MPKPPRFDRDTVLQRLQGAPPAPGERSAAAHPAHVVEGPKTATDHITLDPLEVVLSGPYVREHVDPQELRGLVDAIRAGGDVRQAIGVRIEGPPLEPRYVLVYGMRRWLASKEAGLGRIPARNHGRISIDDALALQVTENEARVDPHPVDTAISYHLLVSESGKTQAEVARLAGRSEAHVSYMRAAGEALSRLPAEERRRLYTHPEATVPRFQRIAPLRPVERRVEALRALLAGSETPPTAPAPRRAGAAVKLRATAPRGGRGRTIQVRYTDDALLADRELHGRVERLLADELARVRALAEGRSVEE